MGRLHALAPLLMPHFSLHWSMPLHYGDVQLRIQVCKHGWYLGLISDFGTYVRASSGVHNLIARIEVAWCDPQMVERIVEFFDMVLKHRDDERQRELEFDRLIEGTTAEFLRDHHGNC